MFGGGRRIGRLRNTLLHVLACALSVAASVWISFLLRFDFRIPPIRVDAAALYSLVAICVQVPVLWLWGWSRVGWNRVSLPDLRYLVVGVATASVASGVIVSMLPENNVPRSIYFLQCSFLFGFAVVLRVLARLRREAKTRRTSQPRKRVLIYGAGLGGQALLRELSMNPRIGYHPVGFVDDFESLQNSVVQGLPVVARGENLCSAVVRYKVDEILVAIPSASSSVLNQIRTWCDQAGRPCKTIPGLGELLSRPDRLTEFRQISFEELLGRSQVRLDEYSIGKLVAGRVMLVTGAAGSIGSELCRQLAVFRPERIIAADMAETPLFELENELRDAFPDIRWTPTLIDVRDERAMEDLLRAHAVDCVLHAAAYKHVPMMERHPKLAVANNVLGTAAVVAASERTGVSHFVMISTDKAVRPSSVMGATKRIAEMVVKSRSGGKTRFVSVRFGNVLGSNGSVVPIFKRQIGAGGPVTVTHPEMRRYFMTIPEASRLVLQAMAMGTADETFVLDMGEPVRIEQLARNLIALHGLEPDQDIRVTYTGLRPGEKLFEELYLSDENLVRTLHEKILVLRGPSIERNWMDEQLAQLRRLLDSDSSAILEKMHQLVPEYVGPVAVSAASLPLNGTAYFGPTNDGKRPIQDAKHSINTEVA